MADLEEEFLDKEEILESEELNEEIIEDEFAHFYNPSSRAYKICHNALKRQTKMTLYWTIVLVAFLGVIGALYGTQLLSFGETSKITSKPSIKEAITVIPFALGFAIAIIAKIISVKKQNRFYVVEKKRFLKGLPDEPNELVQEFYVLQYCRRSSQFWIVLCLVGLSIVTAAYCVLVSGILVASGSDTGRTLLFKMDHHLGFGKDTVTGVMSVSLLSIPLWLLGYAFARSRSTKIIKALEDVYPPEQIMDEVLCNHRLAENNRKQKLIAFAVVCWLGCVVYLFFKKLICNIFEKSFYI